MIMNMNKNTNSFIICNLYYKDYYKLYYSKNKYRYQDYYQDNKDHLLKQSIEYYNKNKIAIRMKQNVYFKEYYKKNKNKV